MDEGDVARLYLGQIRENVKRVQLGDDTVNGKLHKPRDSSGCRPKLEADSELTHPQFDAFIGLFWCVDYWKAEPLQQRAREGILGCGTKHYF